MGDNIVIYLPLVCLFLSAYGLTILGITALYEYFVSKVYGGCIRLCIVILSIPIAPFVTMLMLMDDSPVRGY
jgi:hypothetical protein